jgi:hypothetical protein
MRREMKEQYKEKVKAGRNKILQDKRRVHGPPRKSAETSMIEDSPSDSSEDDEEEEEEFTLSTRKRDDKNNRDRRDDDEEEDRRRRDNNKRTSSRKDSYRSRSVRSQRSSSSRKNYQRSSDGKGKRHATTNDDISDNRAETEFCKTYGASTWMRRMYKYCTTGIYNAAIDSTFGNWNKVPEDKTVSDHNSGYQDLVNGENWDIDRMSLFSSARSQMRSCGFSSTHEDTFYSPQDSTKG